MDLFEKIYTLIQIEDSTEQFDEILQALLPLPRLQLAEESYELMKIAKLCSSLVNLMESFI